MPLCKLISINIKMDIVSMARRDEESKEVIGSAMRFVKTGDRSDLESYSLSVLKKADYQLGNLDKGEGFRAAISDLIKELEAEQQKTPFVRHQRKISGFLSMKEWAGIGVIFAMVTWGASYLFPNVNPKELSVPEVSKSIEDEITKSFENDHGKRRAILLKLINSINSSEQEEMKEIYKDLLLLLSNSSVSDTLVNIVARWTEPLTVKKFDNKVIISTTGQYKIDGFILFFDVTTGGLLSAYYDFGLGIKAIKVFDTGLQSPEYLVSIKYMTQSGTGLYEESVRVYAIEKTNINFALDKPYMEYIDGTWGAYKSDATFEQNMTIEIDKNFPKILATGHVIYTNSKQEELQAQLPDEVYIWDKHYKQFRQTSGRITNGHKTMSEVYADYAEPNGDWFEAPLNADGNSFKKDEW